MRPIVPAGRSVAIRRALLAVAAVAGLLLLGYLAAYALAGPGVARGTTVLGVEIGGQSRSEAATTLRGALLERSRQPVPVRAGPQEGAVDPADAGLSFDVPATVEAALARSWNPIELFDALIGGDDVEPVVAVDAAALATSVDALADQLAREPVDGSVRYTRQGEVRTVAAQEGVRLRTAAARTALAEGYLSSAEPTTVRLPAVVVAPTIDQAEVDRVAEGIARLAVSAPVALTVESATVGIRPVAIARSLAFVADPEGTLEPELDGERLLRSVSDELAPVEKPARDASFAIGDGGPRVVPSRQGREVLPETLAGAVLPVLGETGAARAVTVPLEVSEPEIDTATARSLGVKELVSEYTTYYPSDFAPRLTNIHRAAELMDDTLVLPGKVFSLNGTVGERTAERGFAAGFIISNGRLEVDYGGGVSQLATTVFNAAFFAGLEIVEHHPHSFYISRYPEGRESTVAWGVKDVRIRNDSDHGIFITTSYTSSSVTVRMWGTKRYRIEAVKGPRYDIQPYSVEYDSRPEGTSQGDCVAQQGVAGFRVVVTRLFYRGSEQVKSEEFRTQYAPENEVRCGSSGPPEPKPTPTPTPTPSGTAEPASG
ncbi:MAG TPA: VanW family protein [Actinomycetes bacterium]|nr:VanW family protein [Actinomycetes bacterium]